MPNDSEYDDDLDDEVDEPQDNLRDLRRAAKDAKAAKAELAAAKREVALLKAGVDLDSPVGKLFAKGYDGEITPEAIKAEWATLVPSSTPGDTPVDDGPEISADEAASTAQRQALANGSPADITPKPSAREVARQEAEKLRANGANERDVLASTFDALVSGAIEGDSTVILNGR